MPASIGAAGLAEDANGGLRGCPADSGRYGVVFKTGCIMIRVGLMWSESSQYTSGLSNKRI